VSSFLTAHQHTKGFSVPFKVYTIDSDEVLDGARNLRRAVWAAETN